MEGLGASDFGEEETFQVLEKQSPEKNATKKTNLVKLRSKELRVLQCKSWSSCVDSSFGKMH